MIQDIAPHTWDITYKNIQPDPDSRVLFFSRGQLLVQQASDMPADESNQDIHQISFPRYDDIKTECSDAKYQYLMFFTRSPVSSMTSRRTVSSSDSPISLKPATSAYFLYSLPLYFVKSSLSPLVTPTITAGLMRGALPTIYLRDISVKLTEQMRLRLTCRNFRWQNGCQEKKYLHP